MIKIFRRLCFLNVPTLGRTVPMYRFFNLTVLLPAMCCLWPFETSATETIGIGRGQNFWASNLFLTLTAVIFATLLAALLTLFIIYRRSVRHNMAIFRALPIRVILAEANGKRLLHNTGSSYDSSLSMISDELAKVLADGKSRVCQYYEDNNARTAYISLLPDEMFNKRTAISVSLDSSELQKTQSALLNSEERLRLTLTSIGDGVIATDENERITMLNSVAERLTGFTNADAAGLHLTEVFRIRSYDSDAVVPSPVATALRERRIVELANHTDLISRDGKRYHIADSAAPIMDASGQCLGAILVFRDVTQEYNERDMMRYKQMIMESASETAHLGYFVFDIAGMKMESTMSLPIGDTTWTGDVILNNIHAWILPDDYEIFATAWEKLLTGKSVTEKISFRTGSPQNVEHYMLFMQILLTGGNARKIVGLVQNLSDIKKVEAQYLDTLALLHSFIQTFPTPAYIKNIDDDFRYLCANSAFARMRDIERQEIIGKSDFELNGDAESAQKMRDADLLIKAGAEPSSSLEKIFVNDHEYYYRSVKMAFTSPVGRRYLLGLSFDVTSEETAKRQQNETQLLLREIIDNLPLMLTVKSPDQGFRYLYWNTATALHTGISPEMAADKTDFDIFPDVSRAEIFHNMDTDTLDNSQKPFLMDMKNAQGEMRQFDSWKKLFRMPSGKRLILSLYRDVTIQKQMEAKQLTLIDQLTKHVDYERLFNSCLHNLLLSPDLHSAADGLLRQIGEALGADRCYIFQYSPDGQYASNLYEWCSCEVHPAKDTLQNLPVTEIKPWHDALLHDNRVLIDDVTMLEGEWKNIRDILEPQGIRSLLCSSIVTGGKHWGFMGIDFVKKTHQIAECDRLLLSGAVHIFSLAWERHLQTEAVAQSVSLQRQTFESVSIPLVLFDLQHNILDINAIACESVGRNKEELIGRKCYETLCDMTHPPQWCPMDAALKIINR